MECAFLSWRTRMTCINLECFRWDHLGARLQMKCNHLSLDSQLWFTRLPPSPHIYIVPSCTNGRVVSRAVGNSLVLTSIICVSMLSVFVTKGIGATSICLNRWEKKGHSYESSIWNKERKDRYSFCSLWSFWILFLHGNSSHLWSQILGKQAPPCSVPDIDVFIPKYFIHLGVLHILSAP